MPAHEAKPIVGYYNKRVLADWRAALQWLRIRRPDEWRIPIEEEEKDEMAAAILEALARAAERRARGDEQD